MKMVRLVHPPPHTERQGADHLLSAKARTQRRAAELQPGRHAVGKALLPPTKAGAPRRVVSQVPFGVPFWRGAPHAARPTATACALRLHSNPTTSAPRRPHPLFLSASILAQPQAWWLNSETLATFFFSAGAAHPVTCEPGHVTAGHVPGLQGSSLGFRSPAGLSEYGGGYPGGHRTAPPGWWGRRAACSGQDWVGAGPGRPSPQSSALLFILPAADEPDDPRPGAGAGVRARVGATLVGGGDPQEQPELVAGGWCGRERRAPGTGVEGGPPGVTRSLLAEGWEPRILLHPVYPAVSVIFNNTSLFYIKNATVADPRHLGGGGPVVLSWLRAPIRTAAQTRGSVPCLGFPAVHPPPSWARQMDFLCARDC